MADETSQSTADSLKAAINNNLPSTGSSETYDPEKDKANFGKDLHGNKVRKGDFKDKLNKAAVGNGGNDDKPPEGLLERGR
jgi:hypothetical protein